MAGPSSLAATEGLRDSLRRLEEESWELYLEELRHLDVVAEEVLADDWGTPRGQFLRSDAGHPLGEVQDPSGAPYPSGSPIYGGLLAGRHIDRWYGVLRADPCSYCGRRDAGTVDHVTPRARPDAETHTWVNAAGACGNCNRAKGRLPLLEYLRRRVAGARGVP